MATTARSIASVSISFGLVTIPVKVFSATLTSSASVFICLRSSDSSRVKQQYIAVNDGKLVDRSEMSKGYEFAKDQYVTFSPQELKQLEDATTHSIDIQQFVPLETVDPVYFADTYYLAPDKGGAKPYSLLSKALENSKQCAIGRWVSRGKEHIVLIRSLQHGLGIAPVALQSRGAQHQDVGVEAAAVSEAELKLADQLIDHLTAKRFDPNEYEDEFRARVQAAVDRKVQGKEVSTAEAPERSSSSNVIDLMSALKASLEGKGAAGSTSQRKGPKRAAPAAAKTRSKLRRH
jgi:DNA end-binding protein Ku